MSKKLTGKALAKSDAKRDVWQEVLDSVREIKAGKGKRTNIEAKSYVISRARCQVTVLRPPVLFFDMVRIATKTLSKAEREREVFRRFGMASGLLPGGSFESRPDSEPDILYTPDAGPPQAFELVELVDRSYSGSVARQRDSKEACVQYLQSLPEGKQAAFHQAFADAEIALGFKPRLSMQRRKNLLPEVFQILMNLPVGFQGDVPTNRKLTQNLQFLVVHRGRFIGPLFDAPSTVWMGDPSVPGIKSKMSKTYKPVGELNLLAYIDGNPMPPDDVCFSALDAYLESLDKECLFAHIFVFGCHSNVVHRTWHRDI